MISLPSMQQGSFGSLDILEYVEMRSPMGSRGAT